MWQLGFFAGICTSGCMIPQLIKIAKTKSSNDISWSMLVMNITGNGLWIAHGGINKDAMLITFASISFFISAGLIGIKVLTQDKLPMSFTPLKEDTITVTNV